MFPNDPTIIAAVNDVLAYLSREDVWTGDELDVLEARNAIAVAIITQQICEDDDMPIGSITVFAVATLPAGWLACDGATYNRVDYPELFALLDPNYQLDADTFRTPDLRGYFVMGGGHGDYPLNSSGGTYTHTLTAAQMPYHQHLFPPHAHSYSKPVLTTVSYASGGESGTLVSIEADDTGDSGYIQDGGQGSSEAHPNTPPYVVLQYAIRAQ